MAQSEIISKYRYENIRGLELALTQISETQFKFSYQSFDGALVNGQISYPNDGKAKHPVLIGMHAMGRSFPRWWVDSIEDRPTITHVNHIAEFALDKGYAVIAIDARNHGSRKDPNLGLKSIMTDLHVWGEKKHYENMIKKSVMDYSVLLDWIEKQPDLDKDKITVAGYSMGGQMSLLLAGVDKRIGSVVSIVPPFIDDKVALVAPKNLVDRITQPVLLVTADEDEYATSEQNLKIFDGIPSSQKKHLVYKGGHLLPEAYVADVQQWLVLK